MNHIIIDGIYYAAKSPRGKEVREAQLDAWWHRIKTGIKLWTPLVSVALPAIISQSFT